MKYPRKALSIDSYIRATQDGIEKAKSAASGKDLQLEVRRHLAVECPGCFYKPQIDMCVGMALSSIDCAICGHAIHSSTTDVKPICPGCGTKRGLCTECCGDLEGRVRANVDLSVCEEVEA